MAESYRERFADQFARDDIDSIEKWLAAVAQHVGVKVDAFTEVKSASECFWVVSGDAIPRAVEICYDSMHTGEFQVRVVTVNRQMVDASAGLETALRCAATHGVQIEAERIGMSPGWVRGQSEGVTTHRWFVYQVLTTDPLTPAIFLPVAKRLADAMKDAQALLPAE